MKLFGIILSALLAAAATIWGVAEVGRQREEAALRQAQSLASAARAVAASAARLSSADEFSAEQLRHLTRPADFVRLAAGASRREALQAAIDYQSAVAALITQARRLGQPGPWRDANPEAARWADDLEREFTASGRP